jgi:RHS repeat-associated protein
MGMLCAVSSRGFNGIVRRFRNIVSPLREATVGADTGVIRKLAEDSQLIPWPAVRGEWFLFKRQIVRSLVPTFRQRVFFLSICLIGLPVALHAQLAPVSGITSTPLPGSGHDYLQGLNETVDPSSGSLSIRIAAPAPQERGMNMPRYVLAYDTNGQYTFTPYYTTESTGYQILSAIYLFNLPVTNTSAPGTVSFQHWTTPYGTGANQVDCDYQTNYIFTDPNGGRHNLDLQFQFGPFGDDQASDACAALGIYNHFEGGDESYKATLVPNAADITHHDSALYIADSHGNTFSILHADASDATANGVITTVPEDTNGNGSDGTGRNYSVQLGPAGGVSAGLPVSVAIPGLAAPYQISYQSYPFNAKFAFSGSCTPTASTYSSSSGSTTTIEPSSVTIPNGQQYTFGYEGTYGFINHITYPTGATVDYTWSVVPLSQTITFWLGGNSNSQECPYFHDWMGITKRVVSFDGTHPALEQDFAYTTSPGSTGATWTSKTTTVTTKDLTKLGTPSFKTVYTYSPMTPSTSNFPLAVQTWTVEPIPVENTISYYDTNGALLKTVTKTWLTAELLSGECTTLPSGSTSGVFYQYEPGSQLNGVTMTDGAQWTDQKTDVAEYDYGLVSSSCQKPTTTPTRETVTSYQSFATTPLFPAGPSILDRPQSVKIYGNGTLVSETDSLYNATTAPVTPAAVDHDETNYSSSSPAPRGNATTVTRKCSPSCSDAVTTYSYDETGQVVSVTDPRGYLTKYSYADNYSSDDGSPQGNTNTYLTNLTRPTTNGMAHITSYKYGFNDGKLRTVTDENFNLTTYCYYVGGCSGTQFDQWFRTTEVSYPDRGQTNVSYQDAGPSPSTTVSTLLDTSGDTEVSTTVFDGMGHITQTQLTSDTSADIVLTTYDGLGRVSTKTNPYRSTSDPTYGVATYQYDALSRPVSVQNPDGSFQYWCYDDIASAGQNNCKSHIANTTGEWVDFADESGNDWQRTTDSLGRLTNVVEPNGASHTPSMETDYKYDANNDLTEVDQWGGPEGSSGELVRNFNYDTLSRVTCASNPESATNPQNPGSVTPVPCPPAATGTYTTGTLGYTYDANGNVMTREDARGVITTYGYDSLNRVQSKIYNDNGNTPSVSYTYDSGVLGVTSGNYVGRLAQVETMASGSVLYNYSTLGYDTVGRPLGYLECPAASNCLSGASTVLGANYQYDLAGNTTQVMSQGTMASNGNTVGGINQRNYSYNKAGELNTVTADARLVGAQDAGLVTLFNSPTYNASGQLTAASLAINPTTQQSMIGLTRTYDNRLRPLSESDTGQVGTPGTPATATVNVTGTEQSIGGSGTPTQATGAISLSYSGGALVRDGADPSRVQPLLVGSSITLPDGYHASFVPSSNSALATANTLAGVLNSAFSPVTAVVASGGSASAASVLLTTKATGADENGAITLSLVATQVKAAPASLSGGAGTTYDTGTVTANVNGTAVTTSYGQTSTPQSLAAALATAITGAGAGVTATSSPSGTITVTANQAGTVANGWPVTLSSTTDQPKWFSSPSFSGTSGSLGGGSDETLSPGTIYSYSIPSPPTANTGYAGNGNLLSFTDLVNGQWTQIGYDTLNRLTTATVAGTPSTTLTWSYDPFGNRKSQGPNGGTSNYPPGNNRISGYSYDASGNVLDDGSNQYVYDGEGRLCTVYNKTMASYTAYAYDGLGNRVAKGGGNGLSCDNNLTATSTFIVGPNGEQLDALNANGAVYSNVFANGQLLATDQFPSSGWTYALNDWVGTKRFVAKADGTQAEICTGLPFGDGLNCTGTGSDPSPQHFTGKERDTESNNDYFGARYYSSNTGRFMTPDPGNISAIFHMDDPQSWNGYAYAHNNPLTNTDPTGDVYQVCDENGQNCSFLTDQQFESEQEQDQRNGESFQSGQLSHVDSNGNVVQDGTYRQTDVDIPGDAASNVQAANMIGNGGMGMVNGFMKNMAVNAITGGAFGAYAETAMAVSKVAELSMLKPLVSNPELREIVDELFQATDTLPGGTAGAVRYEGMTGDLLSPAGHAQEAGEIAGRLENMLSGKSGPSLSVNDQGIVVRLINDLRGSLAGK